MLTVVSNGNSENNGGEIPSTLHTHSNLPVLDQINQEMVDFLNTAIVQTLSDAYNIGGMNVRAWATNYPILTSIYQAIAQTVTLGDSDAIFGRKDAIVADVNGVILVIPGTPSATVSEPFVDTNSYYLIRYLLVPANSLSPVDPDNPTASFNTLPMYAEEGTEAAGESDVSVSDLNSLTVNHPNIELGSTKVIRALDATSLDTIFFEFSVEQNTSGYTHLNFKLKLLEVVRSDKYWFVRLFNGNVNEASKLFTHGQFGYNANSLEVQYISIPLEEANLSNRAFTKFALFLFNYPYTSSYYVDDFLLEDAFSTNPNITTQIQPNSVGLTELKHELKGTTNIGAGTIIDWAARVQTIKTMDALTDFTNENLVRNKTVFLMLTGSFAFSLQYITAIENIADYDGTMWNVIQLHCSDNTAGTEKITANLFDKFSV